jgi:hypothetical protein
MKKPFISFLPFRAKALEVKGTGSIKEISFP